MLEEVELLFHKKLEAPLAVRVTELPEQMEEAEALIFTLGAALTTIIVFAEPEQPPFIPVTK